VRLRVRDGEDGGGGVQWAFRRVGGGRLRVRMLNMTMEGRVENGRLRVRMLYMYMEGGLRMGG
jgi:hypothetical protein